jgi:hypothetical protein
MTLISIQSTLRTGVKLVHRQRYNPKWSQGRKEKEFRKHYGSSSFQLATQWYDLTTTNIKQSTLTVKEKTRQGFKMFLAAHYYMWSYPKNINLFASVFGINEKYASGVWVWIEKISGLSEKVIKWNRSLDDPTEPDLAISIDGTDNKRWELKHPTMPLNRKIYSKKFNHGASKWQIVLDVHKPKCVGVYGPCRGGLHDQTMLKESGILEKLKKGKLAIVDRGYIKKANRHKLSWPNDHDSKAVNNFKSRARMRHETFNGRLKNFAICSCPFRHSQKKHGIAFLAVVVTVQYQMDNGNPIFSV